MAGVDLDYIEFYLLCASSQNGKLCYQIRSKVRELDDFKARERERERGKGGGGGGGGERGEGYLLGPFRQR